MTIETIRGLEVYDSRGNPTVEAEVILKDGSRGRAIAPSGASTGQFEAHELRDGDGSRLQGRGVSRAVNHIDGEIASALVGLSAGEQAAIDRRLIDLDGTRGKTRLGANAILAVSMAVARAAAASANQPLFSWLGEGSLLPVPEIQIIGGGAHSAGRIDIQDFMVIATGARSYRECLEVTFAIYHTAGRLLKERGLLRGLADEGGFWPEFETHEAVFDFLVEVIETAGFDPGHDVGIALDIAATEFYHDGRYRLSLGGESLTSEDFSGVLARWLTDYPVVSVEDPFADVDEAGWAAFRKRWGDRIQIIGDDLFTTHVERVERGISENLANAVLIKLNQIGTVTETLECIRRTQEAGWRPVVSARSGETEDAFIAHLAVATAAGQLKVGSFARSERMVKWNEVLRIERELGERARFDGWQLAGRP